MRTEFIPKSFEALRSYSSALFKKDLLAGITVGIIALPLAMAFAIASGVEPARGLYTAIVAGFLISALGGSRIQIGGPTGAFVVLVYSIVEKTGYSGLCTSTLIGGALLILLGVFRVGRWIRYVPLPLITGFTTGIAVLIFSTQIKDFFGLAMGAPPAEFTGKWWAYIQAFPAFDITTTCLAVGTFGAIIGMRRYVSQLPWGIGAIVLATGISVIFQLPVETIHSRFGEIPQSLPLPHLPELSWSKEIFTNGVIIAFLGGVESLLSAVIGDGLIGGRHRSNCELIAQGIANIVSVAFGGIPATGAIARTAANAKTGAQTPVAGMIHAITLLGILCCLSPFVSQIPLAALSAVLIMVAWNMSELKHFRHLLKAPKEDRLILFTAFGLTVFVDITVAISAGMILASFLFMKRMSHTSKIHSLSSGKIGVYAMEGPLFFGTKDLFKDLLQNLSTPPRVFILQLQSVPFIDASGLHALQELHHQCKAQNTSLLLSGVSEPIQRQLQDFALFNNTEQALIQAEAIVAFN